MKKKNLLLLYMQKDVNFGRLNILSNEIKNKMPGSNVRYSIFGHIQRGGTAVPSDRILGTILGYKSVELILNGEKNMMVGIS